MAIPQLPDPTAQLVDSAGRPTREYYEFMQAVARLRLSDLKDVSTAAPANGDVLTFSTSSSKWEPN